MDALSHYFYGGHDEIYVVHHYKRMNGRHIGSYYGRIDAIIEDNWLNQYNNPANIPYPETYKFIDERSQLISIIDKIIFEKL